MVHQPRRPVVAATMAILAVQLAAGVACAASRILAAPRPETPDLAAYSAIRREAHEHPQAMDFAAALTDGIGARLTGSPNLARAESWACDTLKAMGLEDVRQEDWGEFGTGWAQVNAWARMSAPDSQPLWLQAAPWSAPTPGPITAAAVFIDPDALKPADLDKLKGTLKGRIVLLGAPHPAGQPGVPFSHRYTDAELTALEADGSGGDTNMLVTHKGRVLRFLRSEGVAAIIEPSRDQEAGGGTGLIVDDNGADIVNEPWVAAKASAIPHAVMLPEHYGRLVRLIQRGGSVTLQLDIETRTTGDHQHGYNVLAELPGSDPDLKAQVVMAGAHLDSWAAGTGATDNGAGVAAGMEAMRLLKAAGLRPRRTIVLALWTGEEQGLYGSRGYVRDHLGVFAPPAHPPTTHLPPWLEPHGALIPRPDWNRFDAYFNLDAGAGRIRGVYTGGDLVAAALFRSWIAPLSDMGVSAVSNAFAQGSDQEAFQAAGLPAFAFLQDPLDYETRAHHSNLDTLERLDGADLEQASVVEAAFLYGAAQRGPMLDRPAHPHPELDEAKTRPVSIFPNVGRQGLGRR